MKHLPISTLVAFFTCRLVIVHVATLLLAGVSTLGADEPPIKLWPQGAPGALGTTANDIPTLTPYVPAKANGAAMLLIPGGSYSSIYEGQAEPFALWLNEQGVTVFVLRYRLGSAGYRYPAQLQDAMQAMRQVRTHAAQWKIDSHRLGVMGFSAGGHLVSTLLTHPEGGEVALASDAGGVSARPNLAILCYPVISMITRPHELSRRNLIGTSPSDELVRRTSSELQVQPGLPPCFIWHTTADKLVSVDHSLLFATALQEHGVPYELHLYQHGDHGTGLMGTDHPWFRDLLFWLKSQEFLQMATD
ncbi:MAG: alpha/beta hydrolase [Verrucomicrobia bacterium]|nr:alpha/beta hydrolase [Verrucomicrobiota bacterium]